MVPSSLAPSNGLFLSLVVEAPVVPLEVFLRLPIPGEPLLWDDSCWGGSGIAARGAAMRWSPEAYGGFLSMARAASDFLAQAELRSPCVGATIPRCYGGLAFDPRGVSESWASFGSGGFVLPRVVYERDADRARLRVHLLRGEPPGPLLELLHDIQLYLKQPPQELEPPSPAVIESDSAVRYREVVAAAVQAIERGQFEKVVAARALTVRDITISPWTLLDRLRGEHVVRFALGREDAIFLGATPERLVSFDGQEVLVDALAGSKAVGLNAKEALLSSEKDLREHRVVVDAIRQALEPLCSSLKVPARPQVRTLRHLLHLETPIRGEADSTRHILDLVGALHPTPAVCGVPKATVADWLREHEHLDRGWYAAPVGWFDGHGRGSFAVALRSALLRGSTARIFVGAGLVRGSTPEGELAETALKARALLEALRIAS